MYENDKKKTLDEYQEWVETLLTPEELSEKLTKLFKKPVSVRAIARERKVGMPVGAILRRTPMYDLKDVLMYFEKKAKDDNKQKMKELKKASKGD